MSHYICKSNRSILVLFKEVSMLYKVWMCECKVCSCLCLLCLYYLSLYEFIFCLINCCKKKKKKICTFFLLIDRHSTPSGRKLSKQHGYFFKGTDCFCKLDSALFPRSHRIKHSSDHKLSNGQRHLPLGRFCGSVCCT